MVTTTGGATGHGVIVASSRGSPSLPVEPRLTSPTARSSASTRRRHPLARPRRRDPAADPCPRRGPRHRASAAATLSHEPAVTPTGRRVLVEANVASLADAHAGAAAGADGSGLVRTEILFAHEPTAPDAATQAAALIAVGKALDSPITVRTWDPGGDKPLPFLATDGEANPMLGERGLRAMRRYP